MPDPDFDIRQGDTLSRLRATLKDGDGHVIDLTGGTVTFRLRHLPSGTLVLNGVAATVIDAPNGVVEYAWQTGDTDRTGTHHGVFRAVLPSGRQTVPTPENLVIEVTPDV